MPIDLTHKFFCFMEEEHTFNSGTFALELIVDLYFILFSNTYDDFLAVFH